ncbi:UDP-N-acetylglucosamine transferase subunit ALG14 homolog [Tribolium castaneum]|uniref:UDP-N-acetylglucosamine transferase subunit ALG14 n=1 Tax=Tribolium castaneum TaxID=7070 RepID=D6WFE0_TRICA|nr:PREDICTED: UDP-N-acetylglucosamine transferase subunit ALG14 homolog [Tribolium castaneum]EFA00490.1 UDP-N-acetylglucosamine transferase subunit ALG14 homolog-like Protein [Tribolium castaneum]|eukprot:XP_971846.1 PREDICTED: UDP-N-acetylglucosamine transferase subunit ALG14 homolog [Tribolium castaneum]
MEDQLKIELAILIAVLILARILYLVHKITTGFSREASSKRVTPCRTVICIGSGGHTTEMLTLMASLDFAKYSPRYYIMAKTDTTSYAKVRKFEETKNHSNYEIIEIPRSRVVGQSYITSIFTTLYSILYSVPLVCKIRPDLILCNGPGTCIPICLISFLLKAAFISDTRIVFIESFCRTETFSLSGKILMYFADNFLVQWPSLKQKLKRAEYIGQLM